MAQYPVLSLIRHGSKDYEPGDVIELTDEEAAPLTELGAIAKPLKADKKSKDDGKKEPSDPPEPNEPQK